MSAEYSVRKNAFTADGGTHKVARILDVADGLRRIGEFESAEMLTAYAERIEADDGAVPIGYTRVDCVETLKQQDFAPMIRLRQRGDYTVPLFTHTLAQAAQDAADEERDTAITDAFDAEHPFTTAEPAAQGEVVDPLADDSPLQSRRAFVESWRLESTGSNGHDVIANRNTVRRLVHIIDHLAAQLRAVPNGCETVKSDSLPPGYTLGYSKKDGGYWPLLKDGYIGTGWYATQDEAELVAWKHAHGKLDSYMREIRRLATAAPQPGESA